MIKVSEPNWTSFTLHIKVVYRQQNYLFYHICFQDIKQNKITKVKVLRFRKSSNSKIHLKLQ